MGYCWCCLYLRQLVLAGIFTADRPTIKQAPFDPMIPNPIPTTPIHPECESKFEGQKTFGAWRFC
jgi:hypothetical protein